jgi:hypothetical protein
MSDAVQNPHRTGKIYSPIATLLHWTDISRYKRFQSCAHIHNSPTQVCDIGWGFQSFTQMHWRSRNMF